MRERLAELFESSGEFRRGEVGNAELSEDIIRSLEQLGYIDK